MAKRRINLRLTASKCWRGSSWRVTEGMRLGDRTPRRSSYARLSSWWPARTRRRMAVRDCWFSASVLNSTRKDPQCSKAWQSIRYFASVFTAVLCQDGTIHVEPISTRRLETSMFMNRVLPTTCPHFRTTVANPTENLVACSDRTRSTYRLKSSTILMDQGIQLNLFSKAPLAASKNKMGRVRVESAPAELRCLPELQAQAPVSPGFC
jgi:hypothetical protein